MKKLIAISILAFLIQLLGRGHNPNHIITQQFSAFPGLAQHVQHIQTY